MPKKPQYVLIPYMDIDYKKHTLLLTPKEFSTGEKRATSKLTKVMYIPEQKKKSGSAKFVKSKIRRVM